MQFGLRNRLRLISLLPILILFALASYYVYNAYVSYKGAGQLQARLEGNKELNDLINNLSREQGMTVMYMGNASPATLKSLNAQRTIVDEKIATYQKHLEAVDQMSSAEAKKAASLSKLIDDLQKKIILSRPLVDNKSANFNHIFTDIYGQSEEKLINELADLASFKFDEDVNSLSYAYLSLVRANEFSSIERDYITYVLSRATPLSEEELNKWVSLIAKADTFNLEGLNNKAIQAQLQASLYRQYRSLSRYYS
jgi:Nitrate and nitrite sensing